MTPIVYLVDLYKILLKLLCLIFCNICLLISNFLLIYNFILVSDCVKKVDRIMTNPMFNPQPNYSGVTIQIANPAVNVGQSRQVSDYCRYNPYVSNPQAQNLANVPYADYLQAPEQNHG